MPKLKTFSGGEVVKIFYLFGFEIDEQRGSHVKVRRWLPGGTRQTLTIPMPTKWIKERSKRFTGRRCDT